MNAAIDPIRCPRCGASKPAGAACFHCLLQLGLSTSPREPGAPAEGARRKREEPPEPAEIAHHFPGLDLLEPIGHGGMGVVYKARQRKLDRLVALKILSPELSIDPAFAERFLREARAMARLDHPNIVAIHDFGETEGVCWLLMEYVDGVNLRSALKSGALTPERALAIVPQLCDALQSAHDLGVVHRDIKPENVLIDRDGNVKIADFGLAKLSGASAAHEPLTNPSVAMGTVHYMAPEQLRGAHDVDHRADIFSLGVVFYEMLTGALPIGRFEPPSRRVDVDVRLDEIVLRALEEAPERRYQQASEVKTDVQAMGEGRDPVVVPETSPPPQPEVRRVDGEDVGRHFDGAVNSKLAFGMWILVLPLLARTLWTFGEIGVGVLAALTAIWLFLLCKHFVERNPKLREAARRRSKIARWGTTAAFFALAVIGLTATGAGIVQWWELGTDHYASPTPHASTRIEPWSEDRSYQLLALLPAIQGASGEELPTLGVPQNESYRRQHAPTPGATLLLGAMFLVLAAAVMLPGRHMSWKVLLATPTGVALVVVAGFAFIQLRQTGQPDTLNGINGSVIVHGDAQRVTDRLRERIAARGYDIETQIAKQIVTQRARSVVARYTLLATSPERVFDRWELTSDGPTRREPGLVFDIVGSADGTYTHVTWNAGLLRAGETVAERWRNEVEALLDGVKRSVEGG